MRVAIYARVSTTDQKPENQLHALHEYAKARGLELAEEYLDAGVSGAASSRPALDAMLADAQRRAFDAVACVKLDRLARSVRHLTALAAEFEALGVGLIVLDQAIDTTTPSGRLLFNVLGSIAEFERDLIRERTVAGLETARREGKRLGRPPVFVPLTKARALIDGGLSVAGTARELGVSRSTLIRSLSKNVPSRVAASA